MELFAAIGDPGAGEAARFFAESGESGGGLVINWFWIIVSALNFLFFLYILKLVGFGPISKLLEARRTKIDQGLRDAEQARRDRQQAEVDRVAALSEARRDANEIIGRAHRVAQEAREADIAATKAELERLRKQAAVEIEAEKSRAIADLRAEVTDLALQAAGRVVRESMTDSRQRRLVEEFLGEVADGSART